MPRQARLDAPGALHHIIVRGINKAPIFEDPADKRAFLDRLGKEVIESGSSVYAWVLMDNHVHVLFRSGPKGIAAVMRKLLTWYAQYFNRRHNRTGHLFANRYKSILCEEDRYLLALVRYIHLNPIRSGNVKSLRGLDGYPWSGHSAIVGKTSHGWMDAAYVLAYFGNKRSTAYQAYRRFVQDGLGFTHDQTLAGGGLTRSIGGWSNVLAARRKGVREVADERILGSGTFVQEILKDAELRQMRQLKIRASGKTIQDIMDEECTKHDVSRHELQSGGRRTKVSQVRSRIAHRLLRELGVSAAEVARNLGVNTSSITRAVARIEEGKAPQVMQRKKQRP